MAARVAAQRLLLKTPTRIPTPNGYKLSHLNKKFVHPFTFEEASASNIYYSMSKSISTNAAAPARQLTPSTSSPTSSNDSSASYATVAQITPSHGDNFTLAPKFRVPFDEGNPTSLTFENIVEHIESIPAEVQKQRGYHIIGKVKASNEEQLKKILALGDLRVWQ